jgi:hypothetical protein
MGAPTHDDAMLFMEYYKLWDTPLDGEAWTVVRGLRADGAFDDYDTFRARAPKASREYTLVDRVFCAFEQAGVLMKHGLMHPDLYFDGWADPRALWAKAEQVVKAIRAESANEEIFKNFEWLAARCEQWHHERTA